MHPILPLMMLMSVLFPERAWVPVNAAVNVQVHAANSLGGDITLVLTDMDGKSIDSPTGPDSATFAPGATADIHKIFFPTFSRAGTYLLWAVPKGKSLSDFVGTPLVIEIRQNIGVDSMPGPTVIHLEPLVYAAMETDQGRLSLAFFFDSAPNTVDHFIQLSQQGFYDDLTFHRIVPGFIIQGGDPRGDGTGGPGYMLNSEFSDRLHLPGAVSMARETDPNERDGAAPRPEYANSAGSQFFISLDHDKTAALDHHYTVFATVVHGMDTVNKIAVAPVTGPSQTTPKTPVVIKSIRVKPVTSVDDPYAVMFHLPETKEPATEPASEPTTDISGEPVSTQPTEPTAESTTVPAEPTTIPGPRPTTEPAAM